MPYTYGRGTLGTVGGIYVVNPVATHRPHTTRTLFPPCRQNSKRQQSTHHGVLVIDGRCVNERLYAMLRAWSIRPSTGIPIWRPQECNRDGGSRTLTGPTSMPPYPVNHYPNVESSRLECGVLCGAPAESQVTTSGPVGRKRRKLGSGGSF